MTKKTSISPLVLPAEKLRPMAGFFMPANLAQNHQGKDGYVEMRLNAAGDHLDLYIVGVIGWDTTHSDVIGWLGAYSNLKTITVYINSVGGFIAEGLGILNSLRLHKAQVTTVNVGYALSMGSIVLMAADKGMAKMASNALLMIHRAQGGGWGDASDMRKQAAVLEKHEEALRSEYVARTGKNDDEVQALMDAETWLTAGEALELGLVDEIIEPFDEAEVDDQLSANVWTNLVTGVDNMPENVKKRMQQRLSAQALRDMPTVANAAAAGTGDAGNSGGDVVAAPAVGATATPGAPANVVDANAIRQQALADEQQRRNDITAVFERHGGVTGEYADVAQAALNDVNCDVSTARANLLDRMGQDSPGAIGGQVGTAQITQDQRDTDRDLMVNALLSRANVDDVQLEAGNPHAFASLSNLARHCLQVSGQAANGMHPLQMVSNAFTTTSDLPIILDRTINEMVLVSYRKKALTWKRFCGTGNVSDFREHKRLRRGSFGALDELTEAGEYKNKSIPDGETERVSAKTKGNLIAVTREVIINDDLGYISSMSEMLGSAAARTVELDVYKLLLGNPKLSDNVALFHASHKNLVSGDMKAAMNEVVLDHMRQMMGAHKDHTGNEELDIEPGILLVPSTMRLQADRWMKSAALPDQANPNVANGVAGLADVVATSKLRGKGYYLLASADDVPTIQVSFLFGEDEPFIDNRDGWRTDGAEMKVRLDFGVDAVDFRGAVYNPGE